MKRLIFATGLLLPLLGAAVAEAADLQISNGPVYVPPPFSWTGF
jgi:hypothetical protein